ncbi:UNVERIFIED_CONTAM: hypothetical protein FKN15_020450, partial [Acipenser sinensis]
GDDLRLVNGGSPCAGRVEFLHEGRWGTVSSTEWELEDAAVVCKQLGCGSAVSAPGRAHFGAGSGPIWLAGVACSGSHSALRDCRSWGWGVVYGRTHAFDAGVICSKSKYLQFYDSRSRSALSGGSDLCSGRVEVLRGSAWNTVCDAGFDRQDAEVVCRQLQCGIPQEVLGAARFGKGQGPVWSEEIQCSGNESGLHVCPTSSREQPSCTHANDVGLVCVEPAELRLAGSSSPCSGRVEVRFEGSWGTVCDDSWDLKDAQCLGTWGSALQCSTLGARRSVHAPQRVGARCLDARCFGALCLGASALGARTSTLDALVLDAWCATLRRSVHAPRRFGARRSVLGARTSTLGARCTHFDAQRFGARRSVLGALTLGARTSTVDASARDARCLSLRRSVHAPRRSTLRRFDAWCTHLDARRFGARRLDARCSHLDARSSVHAPRRSVHVPRLGVGDTLAPLEGADGIRTHLEWLSSPPRCHSSWRQCRITEAHLKKGYAAATEAVRLSNVASLLTVYQATLLRDLPECPSVALRTELGTIVQLLVKLAQLNVRAQEHCFSCGGKKAALALAGEDTRESYILIDQPKTWYEAQQYCRTNYTDLVSIKNNDEDKKIKEKANGNPVWIGLFNNPWKWSHKGEYSSFHNWDKGEPNSAVNNICVEMYGTDNKERGKWNDARCSDISPFLCYNESCKDASCTKYHFVETVMNWSAAQTYCRDKYTDLATVHSQEEAKQLDNFNISTSAWIGMYLDGNENWQWSNGDDVTYNTRRAKLFCVTVNPDRDWTDSVYHDTKRFMCYNSSKDTTPSVPPSAPASKDHMTIARVKLTAPKGMNLEDPKVSEAILEQIREHFSKKFPMDGVKMRWRKQDGEIFHKDEEEEVEEEEEEEKCSDPLCNILKGLGCTGKNLNALEPFQAPRDVDVTDASVRDAILEEEG